MFHRSIGVIISIDHGPLPALETVAQKARRSALGGLKAR
jgi:hypothetical protein